MNFLILVQVILAALLVAGILFQNRGAGLGSSWGGSGELYMTRRGVEKMFFRATIVIAVLFFTTAMISLLI